MTDITNYYGIPEDKGTMAARTFDISTIKGLRAAERYKSKLNDHYDKVIVKTIGWDVIEISTE